MKYERVEKAVFLSRPNRFTASVLLEDREEICHVKNTGRCAELLIPGTEVWLCPGTGQKRKTKYDLIAVKKGGRLVNMDSQAPNRAAGEWLRAGGLFANPLAVRPEVKYRGSRFDFYLEGAREKGFLEVKGVTLEEEGTAMFPDAPTERGLRHIRELTESLREGYDAWILFVIQMKGVHRMIPNDRTQPQFGEALREAKRAGVRILAMDCLVTEDSMIIDREIPVDFGEIGNERKEECHGA